MKSLKRPFKMIAFDWDGTAVMSRAEDATPVRLRLERLLALGVRIVIITGTNFQNVDRQVSANMSLPQKRDLYVCTNRGSEVYGFDDQCRPKLIYRRVATAEESRRLLTVSERVRQWIENRAGVDVDVICSRLNRCKIDLIPVPEWSDPPKSVIGELLQSVERRLKNGGIAGGLREVIALTQEVASEEGLPEARITSDVKHVEVGLTDKGDSVEWMVRELVERGGLSVADVLIAGDEFGPLDGFPGSDYMMVRTATAEATFVSVGREPNGVPPEVIYLGGGPTRFRELLDEQIALHERPEMLEEEAGAILDGWRLVERGIQLPREHEIESLFSIGNGYLGTRGSLPEGSPNSRPATFIAGVFDVSPQSKAVPELVKAPDWASMRVYVEGQELQLDEASMLEHRRVLDLKQGILQREWWHRDAVGRVTRVHYERFASLVDQHALVESLTLRPENYGGRIAVESAIDGRLTSSPHVEYFHPAVVGNRPVVALRAVGTGVVLAFGLATTFRQTSGTGESEPATTRTETLLAHRLEWLAEMGQEYEVGKLVSAYSSREVPDPVGAAAAHLATLRDVGLETIRSAHVQAWAERWKQSDVEVAGDDDVKRAIHFAIYHLISAANPVDARTSIGARGLTGEAYKGHVFWDTETFMVPFFTFTAPETARTLLRYRHHTLPASRERARSQGYRGALYAWESTTDGEDVTPSQVVTPEGEVVRILCGEIEQHISADVAYAVWQYWQATQDEDFMREAGAEIMLETARFWGSRARQEADGRYHIRRVIGPDEYHEGVDDNAYTNVMAQWNLEQGLETAALLRRQWPERWAALAEQMDLSASEVDEWRVVARDMYTGFDPQTGLFEQFEGFFDLTYVNLAAYEPRSAPMDVILGRKHTQRTQIIKQADVVMLLHLLWDRFPPAVREANFRYYEPRCDHGSSLSPAVHAAVAARLGDAVTAERYFKQAMNIDLANNMGNAALGVHMATQGGIWQAMAFGFAGISQRANGLGVDVHLPPFLKCLSLPFQWRGRRLRVTGNADPARTEVILEEGESIVVTLGAGRPVVLTPERPRVMERMRVPRRGAEVA